MAQWKSLGASFGAGSVIALLLTTTAQAEVTAQQVWQSWKDFSTSMGQTMTAGSEEMAGDTLTVSNVAMTTKTATGSVEGSIEFIAFKELGDGTVEVTMANEYPIAINQKVEGEDPVEVELTIKQTGLKLIASGTNADISNVLNADDITISLDNVSGMPDGAKLAVAISIKSLAGTYAVKSGAGKQIASDLSAASLTFDVNVSDPTTSSDFTMTGTMAGIASKSNATMPKDTDLADMAAALKAGFATDGGFAYGKTVYNFDFKDATSTGKAAGSVASGSIDVAFNADALRYNVSSLGTDITVSSSDMPFPEVNAKIAELAFGLMMPVAMSEEPKPFSFLTKIVGLSVSDEVWGIFDPAAVLPRDPATIVLDLSGQAKWLIDIFAQDPANPTTQTPGELNALTLNQLQVAFGGANLTGTGDFTFDNSDLVTFDGMPKPTGMLDAKLVGGNGLIDKLIQMGLLPEDQAMGARMMLGMFAAAVEGSEDTITSKIEMKADGSIFANGQQIQ